MSIGRSGYLWDVLTKIRHPMAPPEPIWWGADIVLTADDLRAIWEERGRKLREIRRRKDEAEAQKRIDMAKTMTALQALGFGLVADQVSEKYR